MHRNFIYKKRKGHLKANPKHTRSIQQTPKNKNKIKEGIQKNLTRPHLGPNQSKKLIKGKGSSFINNLTQDQKL